MGFAGFRSAAGGIAWRNIHSFFTNPAVVLPALLFPLFFFTAFAGGLSRIQNVPGFDFPPGYTTFEYAFVLLQASAFGGVFTGFSIVRDFDSGFSRRLLLGTPDRRAIIVGYALAGMARAVFTVSVITVVALIVGMRIHGGGLDVIGLYTLAALVNLCAIMFSAGVAMRLRTFQAAPAMQMPIFLALFLAPVYVPLGLLKGWVHAAAQLNPITVVLEANRGFLAGSPAKVVLAYGLLGSILALMLVWARTGLRSAERAAS